MDDNRGAALERHADSNAHDGLPESLTFDPDAYYALREFAVSALTEAMR